MEVDLVAGYLGAGKTTCILGLIEADPEPQHLAVLVNEIGEMGIDGMVMAGTTDVVELSSGCICCSLRQDFREQVKEIAVNWAPRRLLVEPTGVATVSQILRFLELADLQPLISGVRVIVVVDAVTFTERLRDSPTFFSSQVTQADVILLNKTDLVPPARVAAVRMALESMTDGAWIIPTVRGQIESLDLLPPPRRSHEPDDAEPLTGIESRSFEVLGRPSLQAMRGFFEQLAAGRYGPVDRAKGVIETAEGWTRLDVASALVHEEPWGPAPASRLVVIGSNLDRESLERALSDL